MTERKIPDLPAIGALPAELQQIEVFLRKARELIQTREPVASNVGDELDKFVTRRALVDAGLNYKSGFFSSGSGVSGNGSPGIGSGTGGSVTYVPDLTPPPTPSGLIVTAGFAQLIIECDAALYSQGHGHDRTIVYGAKWPTSQPSAPTFTSAVPLFEFQGTIAAYPTELSTRWCIWIKWKSVDGVLSASPAGGANGVQAQTGKIGNVDLGPLIVEAGNLANGAVTAAKVAANAIDLTKFASGIEPVAVAAALPSPSGYTGAKTVLLTTDGKLYRYSGGAWTAAVPATDLTGQITGTQITDGAISTPKIAAGAVTAGQIAANTITAGQIAANSITAGQIAAGAIGAAQIAAGAITAGKLLVTGQGAALNADPMCVDPSGWDNNTLPTSLADITAPSGGRVYESTTSTGVYGSTFPIDPTRNYRASVWVKTTSGAPATYLTCAFYDASNNVVVGAGWPAAGSYNYFGLVNQVPPGAWTKYVFGFGPGETAKIPAGAVKMWVGHLGVYAPSTGAFRFTDYRVTEKADYDLIVDGSIIATKLAANSIAVGTAAIQNGAIVNAMIASATIDDAKIATLSAAKLTVGDGTIGGNLRSSNFVSGVSGWIVQPNGYAEFSNVVIRGTVYASAGTFAGSLSAATGTFAGALSAATGSFAGSLSAATGSFAGSLSAATGTFSGSLSAVIGTFGAVTIATGGSLSSGQTAYNTGIGFWQGIVAGVPKISIGSASGPHLNWDGTTLDITDPSFGAFTASIPAGNLSVSVGAGARTYGSRSVSTSGGKSPFSYTWLISNGKDTNDHNNSFPSNESRSYNSQCWITGGSTSSGVTVAGANTSSPGGTALINTARLFCFVSDANGRIALATCQVSATHTGDFGTSAIGGEGGSAP